MLIEWSEEEVYRMDWKNRRRKIAFVFLMSCLLCTGLTSVRSEAKTDSAEGAAQKQVKSDNIFSFNEGGKPKKWQYTWIR